HEADAAGHDRGRFRGTAPLVTAPHLGFAFPVTRKSYGIELDPAYCDVIVRRYTAYTGSLTCGWRQWLPCSKTTRAGSAALSIRRSAQRGFGAFRRTPPLVLRCTSGREEQSSVSLSIWNSMPEEGASWVDVDCRAGARITTMSGC